MSGKWSVLGREEVYSHPKLSVVEKRIKRPDGEEADYPVTIINKGVYVLPMDEEKNIFLVREYHPAYEEKNLRCMSGRVEESEACVEAAKRELKEETGLRAEKWREVGRSRPVMSVVECPQVLFLAEGLTEGERSLEDEEYIEVQKIKFEEAVRKVYKNEIRDTVSQTLILKTQKLTEEG